MPVRSWLAGALLLIGVTAPARAQLAVDRLWVDFEPKSTPRADVVVRNESKDRYYVTVTPAEIVNPGTDKEQRVEQADPEKLGLLVTPNRLILEPGAIRSIRIVSLNANLASDRIYRVKISPEVGDIDAPAAGQDHALAIKILAAYDILVTARPHDARAKLVTTRGADGITIRNEGNTNMLLFDGQLCPPTVAGKDAACDGVGSRRLYPGASWDLHTKTADESLHAKARSFASIEPKTVTLP
jgi:P pilus assembly chaperone PapD